MLNNIREIIAKGIPKRLKKYVPKIIAQHLYFKGPFSVDNKHNLNLKLYHTSFQVENEIYWYGIEGAHEAKSIEVYIDIIKKYKPKVIWDIGANTGTYGLIGKSVSNESEVHFFEPIPKAVVIINNNLLLNSYSSIIHPYALGSVEKNSEIYLPKLNNFSYGATIGKNSLNKDIPFNIIQIKVNTAKNIINIENPPVLIKIDVEGYEFEVLKGFEHLLNCEMIFLIEILDNESADKLSNYFDDENYDYYNINDSEKTIRKTKKLEKSDYFNYLIIHKKYNYTLN